VTDKTNYQIIPAVPGFQLLTFWFEDDERDPRRERDTRTFDIAANLWRETIIAWRLPPDWYPEPITVHHCMDYDAETGTSTSGAIAAILDPAGAVTEQHTCTFRNLDEWIAHAREEWRRWRQSNPMPPKPGGKPRLAFSVPTDAA
jgi:hypothetical protein